MSKFKPGDIITPQRDLYLLDLTVDKEYVILDVGYSNDNILQVEIIDDSGKRWGRLASSFVLSKKGIFNKKLNFLLGDT